MPYERRTFCSVEKVLSFTPYGGSHYFSIIFQGFPPLANKLAPLTGARRKSFSTKHKQNGKRYNHGFHGLPDYAD